MLLVFGRPSIQKLRSSVQELFTNVSPLLPLIDWKLCLLCAVWYTVSVVSSNSTKSILRNFDYPVTLTELQFIINAAYCFLTVAFVKKYDAMFASHRHHLNPNSLYADKESTSLLDKFPKGTFPVELNRYGYTLADFLTPTLFILKTTLPMGMFQFLGHIASHKATSVIPVSLVHTIKALSPLTTVLIYRFMFKQKFGSKTYLTLLPLMVGVMLSCVKNDRITADSEFFYTGCVFAFVSMLIFVSQNIFAKKILTFETKDLKNDYFTHSLNYKVVKSESATSTPMLPIAMTPKHISPPVTPLLGNSSQSLNKLVINSEKKLDKMSVLFHCSFVGFVLTLPLYLLSEFSSDSAARSWWRERNSAQSSGQDSRSHSLGSTATTNGVCSASSEPASDIQHQILMKAKIISSHFNSIYLVSSRFFTRQLGNKLLGVVSQSHHAHRLPDSQHNSWSHASVQALYTVVRVNVLGCANNAQLFRPVRVFGLRLHLDPDHLDRLVPGRKTSTNHRRQDSLAGCQLLVLALTCQRPDAVFCKSRKTKSRTPIGHLSDGHGVDTFVDASDTVFGKDLLEDLEGALNRSSGCSSLVTRDLHGLHARAESHCQVCLEQTTSDSSTYTRHKRRRSQQLETVFGLRRDKQQHGTLGAGLNPGPRNQALVETVQSSTRPDVFGGLKNGERPVGGHSGFDHLQRLAQRGDLKHVETCPEQDVRKRNGFLLDLAHGALISMEK
ncbi:hypothetical protein OGATHE_001887 [Ogataea polymorpha]|uniref:Sugar phosphate transporter domain-containing protein n=1 Tax=Ogataea polymorpha TaxID=460523 RepID=A0A9P8PKS1_9ASCO|nr:hypothetical protein OGATHE_001887 [Ogataea polymorpha]